MQDNTFILLASQILADPSIPKELFKLILVQEIIIGVEHRT